jgi:hypothetical protein
LLLYYLAVGINDPDGFLFFKARDDIDELLTKWHFFTAGAITLLGFMFLLTARVKLLKIDKEKGLV